MSLKNAGAKIRENKNFDLNLQKLLFLYGFIRDIHKIQENLTNQIRKYARVYQKIQEKVENFVKKIDFLRSRKEKIIFAKYKE